MRWRVGGSWVRRGGGRQEGDGQSAGETHDGDCEGDGEDSRIGAGVIQNELCINAQGNDIVEVDVHAGLKLGPIVCGAVSHRMHATVAEDGVLLAQADLRDFDRGEEIGFLGPIEEVGQGGEDGFVFVGVLTELGNGLGYEHVEPVERFGLVGIDVVVGLREDGRGVEEGGRAQPIGCGAWRLALLGRSR